MLIKFTLPHEEASRLLGFLDLYGVNASTVFPGHKSATEYLREASFRQTVRPGGDRVGACAALTNRP